MSHLYLKWYYFLCKSIIIVSIYSSNKNVGESWAGQLDSCVIVAGKFPEFFLISDNKLKTNNEHKIINTCMH